MPVRGLVIELPFPTDSWAGFNHTVSRLLLCSLSLLAASEGICITGTNKLEEDTALKQAIISLALILALVPATAAQDVTFTKSRFSSVKQPKEIDVNLSISASRLLITARKESSVDLSIPIASIDSISHELAERHRVTEGAAVMAVSLGAGAILMATKTKSHWLTINYRDGDAQQEIVLRLDKSEVQPILDALEARTGKKVESRNIKTSELNPNAGSRDVDQLVSFPIGRVAAALKPAMENEGCNVKEESSSRIVCKRERGSSERTGVGGEEVTAILETSGTQTRVRIVTGKGFVGRAGKENWSTSIYDAMLKSLQTEVASKAP
jgi:hypothetical protein